LVPPRFRSPHLYIILDIINRPRTAPKFTDNNRRCPPQGVGAAAADVADWGDGGGTSCSKFRSDSRGREANAGTAGIVVDEVLGHTDPFSGDRVSRDATGYVLGVCILGD